MDKTMTLKRVGKCRSQMKPDARERSAGSS
jgi:hypothetical protein